MTEVPEDKVEEADDNRRMMTDGAAVGLADVVRQEESVVTTFDEQLDENIVRSIENLLDIKIPEDSKLRKKNSRSRLIRTPNFKVRK